MAARVLHNCIDDEDKIYTESLTFDDYVGRVVTLEEYMGCWYVEDTTEEVAGEELTIIDWYFDCEDCARIAYQLTDCTGRLLPKYTTQDFEDLVGSIIKVPYYGNSCFTISLIRYDRDLTYEEIEYSNTYSDCTSCRQRTTAEPGDATIKCDVDLYNKVTSNFSDVMHQEVMSKRFGVEFCCKQDKIKWWIKQKMLEFDLANDDSPELPEPYVESCCIQVDEPCVLPQNTCNTCDPLPGTSFPTDCNCTASLETPHDCHTYGIEITQEMIDGAINNTNSKADGNVYFGYIPCGETNSVTIAFSETTTEEYCVIGIPILGWFNNNEWVNASEGFMIRGDICENVE